jgi:hypothetical protein
MKAIESLVTSLGLSGVGNLLASKPTGTALVPAVQKKADELITKPADMGQLYVATKTVVVYNPLSLDAVVTAAVLKDRMENVEAIPVGNHIDETGSTYLWLGVKENQALRRSLKIHKAQHKTYLTEDVASADETGYRPPMLERVCMDHGIHMSHRLCKMAFHMSRFYRFDARIDSLEYCYQELQHALSVLGHPVVRQNYMTAVEHVKQQLGASYQYGKALSNGDVHKVLITNIHDASFTVALRLIKLRGLPFLNYSNGVNGTMIYTDLSNPQLEENGAKMVLLLN